MRADAGLLQRPRHEAPLRFALNRSRTARLCASLCAEKGPPVTTATTPRESTPAAPRRHAVAAAAAALAALAVAALPAPASGAAAAATTIDLARAKPVGKGGPCTKYAAPWGRDGSRGTKARPYRTVQRLADALRRGQTGCLRGGRYEASGDYVVSVDRGGIRLRSAPGERAQLVGIVMIRQGSDGAVLSHLAIEGNGAQNTIKVHAADVVIEHNSITNRGRGWSCLMLGDNAGWGAAVRTVVRRNRFHDCGSTAMDNKEHAIYGANLVDGRIVGNVFWNTAAYAIHLYPNSRRTWVARNVIDGSDSVRGGIVISGDESHASSDNVIERNVVAFSRTANIETWWGGPVGSGNLVRRNCVWAGQGGNISGSGVTVVGNLVASPRFRDRSAHDYRLSKASRCRTVVGGDPLAPSGG